SRPFAPTNGLEFDRSSTVPARSTTGCDSATNEGSATGGTATGGTETNGGSATGGGAARGGKADTLQRASQRSRSTAPERPAETPAGRAPLQSSVGPPRRIEEPRLRKDESASRYGRTPDSGRTRAPLATGEPPTPEGRRALTPDSRECLSL